MTFALGAARSGYNRADQTVHFSAGKKATNRVRQRTPSDVVASASWLAQASNLLGRPGACGRHRDDARTRLHTT